MNKTVTINLSGIVFHIEERAFETLRKYLDNLKLHFAGTSGRDEIVADIESRMAEMFSEKVSPSKNVIVDADVEEVIAKMGKPEDLGGDESISSGRQAPGDSYQTGTTRRRLFRNPDDRWLGGVCSGIASYFDIDPLWLRLAFVLAIFLTGSGLLLYIILWIIIPVAKTPSEKLQMRGEEVNLASIKKSVEDEIKGVRDRAVSASAQNTSNSGSGRSAPHQFGDFFVDVMRALAKFIIVVFGVIITMISLIVLFALSLAVFSGAGIVKFVVPHVLTNMVLTDSQITWLIVGGILAVGIPFTLLLLNGFKLLFRIKLNLRRISAVLAGIWLIGVGICVYEGFSIGSEFQNSTTIKQSSLYNIPGKAITLKAYEQRGLIDIDNDHFHMSPDLMMNEAEDSVYGKMVHINMEPSDNDSIYVVKSSSACGSSYSEAKEIAERTNYSYNQHDSVLAFPEFFGISTHDKYRGQEVSVTIHIPVGRVVYFDKSIGDMLNDVQTKDDVDNWDLLGKYWIMTSDGLKTIDSIERPEQPEKPEQPENPEQKENDGIHFHGKHGRIDIDSTGVRIDKTSQI